MKKKIILLNDDIDPNSFVAETFAGAKQMDATEIMATDYVPGPDDAPVQAEFNCVFREMSEAEAEALKKSDHVTDVIDDIEVRTMSLGPSLDGLSDEEMLDQLFAEDPDALDNMPNNAPPFLGEIDPTAFELEQDGLDIEAVQPTFDGENELDVFGDLDSVVGGVIGDADVQLARIVNCRQAEQAESKATHGPRARVRQHVYWNARMVGAPTAWRNRIYGQGTRVAVIDTGIGTNPLLRPRGGVSFVPGVTSWRDDNGHGTHVAGTIAGYPARVRLRNGQVVVLWYSVAPLAEPFAVKVLDGGGRGKLSWILNGLAWCLRNRMHVVNLSLGSAGSANPREFNVAYERVGRRMTRAGIALVAAAGNSGATPRPFVGNPARCPSYQAVSAVDRRGARASFSSFGPQVEIAAPGAQILSLAPARGFRVLSGTSMACPHVAGATALVKTRYPAASGREIRWHLDRTARDLGTPGRDPFFGFGLVNIARAIR